MNDKYVPTSNPVSILKRYHLNDGGLIEDVTGWLCQFEDAQVEIRRLSSALASIGEYDCPGGVSPKHCLGCAACDANKALENHGPVVPGGVGLTDLAARSPVETQPTTSNEGNDALRSFEIIWSVISQQYPYWAIANTMHADNVRVALSIDPEELQRAVGILATRRESSAHETSALQEDKADMLSMASLVARLGREQSYHVPAELLKRASAVLATLADSRTTRRHRGCGTDCDLPAGHLGDHVPPEEPSPCMGMWHVPVITCAKCGTALKQCSECRVISGHRYDCSTQKAPGRASLACVHRDGCRKFPACMVEARCCGNDASIPETR